MNSSAEATAVEDTRERKENGWLRAIKESLDISLFLFLLAIMLVTLPFLLFSYMCKRMYYGPPVNTPEDSEMTHECHDYARGYAQGLEEAAHHRRRADEAEREVERLRRELQDSQ